MVSKRVSGKQVLRINPKKSLSPFYGEIIVYPHRQLIKKNVAIWAKAKSRRTAGYCCLKTRESSA
jgi:hypothetical protein